MSDPENPPKPKKASGARCEEWQRKTVRVVLRLPPDAAAKLRARALAENKTVSGCVAAMVEKST